MTANSISSAGISAYARASAVAMGSSLRTQDSPTWPVENLSAPGGTRAGSGDTVSLPKGSEARDPAVTRQTADTEKVIRRESSRNADGVVFVYTFKGDLRIKFMDSFNNLVYQTPPEFFARISDIMNNSTTGLDMTV